ncbi:hypothetical protein ACFXO9_34455 [Nocardia tengchongensis]|uniref:hypothetical protein n=1 Tax=Nocardia tengchongensis TaxID=2055889 RepID=UPI0036CFE3A0
MTVLPERDNTVANDYDNPGYRAWCAGHAAALDEFLTVDAAAVGALPDPWTLAGLRAAIAMARTRFPDRAAVLAEENHMSIDRLGRFVGEVFVRRFDGCWCNVLDTAPAETEVWPMIRCRGYLAGISPHCEVELAIVEGRSGGPAATQRGIVAELFVSVAAKHSAWTTTDRLSNQVRGDVQVHGGTPPTRRSRRC